MDNRLGKDEWNALHAHLMVCPPCQAAWEEEEQVKKVLKTWCKPKPVPASLEASIHQWLNDPSVTQNSDQADCTQFRDTMKTRLMWVGAILLTLILILQFFPD